MANIAPYPEGSGALIWKASPVRAPPAISPMMLAPRASACSTASTTRMPAASPNTKPSRPASNGREAFSGSSFRFERAPMLASAAKATGRIADSVPPAMTTSTSPCSIMRCASMKACTPEAQAATLVITGPRILFWMLIWAAAMEGESTGTMKGLTRLPPCSMNVCWPSATSPIPPPPVFTTTAMSSRLWSPMSSPEWSIACRPAATAICANRLMRRACLKSIQSFGSNPLISAAMRTSSPVGSNWLIVATPETPATRLAQKVGTSLPMGVTAPSPVTTARRAGSRGGGGRVTLVLVAAEDDAAVVPAEPHRVGERHPHVGGARFVGDVVEGELRVGVPVADRRREAAGRQHLGAHVGLDRSRGSHGMAGHRLCAADGQPIGVLAEHVANGHRLESVIERRAGSVRVDVVDLFGTDAGPRQRRTHGALVALAAVGRRRHVVRIGRGAVSEI